MARRPLVFSCFVSIKGGREGFLLGFTDGNHIPIFYILCPVIMKCNNSTGSVCNRGELSGGADQARCGGKQNGR